MSGFASGSWAVLVPAGVYLLAAAAAIPRGNGWRRASSLLVAIGALAGAVVAVAVLREGNDRLFRGWEVFNGMRFDFRSDSLSAFFLLVISLPAIAAAIYGLGYLDAPHAGEHDVPDRRGIDAALSLFLAAMTVLIVANTVTGFLVAWELMSIVSFFLVLGDGRDAVRRGAAYTYVVMTHIATAFIVFALLALARNAGSLHFDAIAAASASLGTWERDAIFVSAFIGFGTKAGLIPVHVWLPKAHPAAPSHVSALMSGVMVKMAIYGLIRLTLEWNPDGPQWWGIVLVAIGGASGVLGILYALMERDLKRILAYSTVEHLGILTMGLGAAVLMQSTGHPEVAAFALVATCLHALNHSVFKSLLFLCAGAVQVGTGTRDLERLGGLVRRMPRTTGFVIVGAAAIAALPPLSGFASEWTLFQAFLRGGVASGTAGLATLLAVAAAALALTGALAVACFVRFAGVGFLAQPRTEAARTAHEVPSSMQAGMGLLTAGCLLLGLGAPWVWRLVAPVASSLIGERPSSPFVTTDGLAADRLSGGFAPVALAALLLVAGVVPWGYARLTSGPGRSRVSPPWVCGFRLETRMQYTATAFAKPFRLIFQFLIKPDRALSLDHPETPYVTTAVHYDENVRPVYDRYIYTRLTTGVFAGSRKIRPLQSGSIRAYLGYVLVTLVVVILLAR